MIRRLRQSLSYRLNKRMSNRRIGSIRSAFESCLESPGELDIQELHELQQRYPEPPQYGYDYSSLVARGEKRASQLVSMLRGTGCRQIGSSLELGCYDGMVSRALSNHGVRTTAVDIRSSGFQKAALAGEVDLLVLDSAALAFEDERFEFVFSYDAFEHFPSPYETLQETLRVLKKGGYCYLFFGPLYMSPLGLHAYRSITVPYCQFLFSRPQLDAYVEQHGLSPINYAQLNEWQLADFRRLWQGVDHDIHIINYEETVDLQHINLIKKYPAIFKQYSSSFDEFIVSSIGLFLQKK